MLTKSLLIGVLAACGVPSTTVTTEPLGQPDGQPPEPPEEGGQHFCCSSIDLKTKSGDGCVTIDKSHIPACNKVLHCGDDWAMIDGKVTCL